MPVVTASVSDREGTEKEESGDTNKCVSVTCSGDVLQSSHTCKEKQSDEKY